MGWGGRSLKVRMLGICKDRGSLGAERKPLGPEEARPGLRMTLFQPRETGVQGRKLVVQTVKSTQQGQEGGGDACPPSGEQGTGPGSGGMGTGSL